ncbi:hypothetical protein L6452_28118 [Arctium lappa]|uniref:Uncharacterized protein n=1 Tax=Arctium lappa TaxID=4217 RepID=A0ACB8ZXD8_ARCLA|nr:hypothetical protein L6452_28118 [Arctium lappa]
MTLSLSQCQSRPNSTTRGTYHATMTRDFALGIVAVSKSPTGPRVPTMVRNNFLRRDRFELFDRLDEDERLELPSTPNTHFGDRHDQISARGFWPERGIALEGLESTTIPGTIPARGDTQVEISTSAINEYLHIPAVPDEVASDFDDHGGMPIDVVHHRSTGDLSASLRHDGSDMWGHEDENVNHGDLHPDAAFWTVFLKCSLLPSSHRTNVSVETSQILFAIQHNYVFDVGHIIFNQILKFGCEMRSLIYFPCLITYFCRRAGIAATFDESALEAPKSNIGKKVYNHFYTHHGLPNLPTEGRRYRNRGRGAAAQHQDEDRQGAASRGARPSPPPPVGGHQGNQPPWERITQVVERNSEEIRMINQCLDRVLDERYYPVTYQQRSRDPGVGPSSSPPRGNDGH